MLVVPAQHLRGDRGVVQVGEAVGAVGIGMVAGRAHRAEGVLELAGHHRVGGGDRGTSGMTGRRPGVAVHRRVGIDMHQRGAARLELFFQLHLQPLQGGEVKAVVGEFEVTQGCLGRHAALQGVGHAGDQQAIFDCIQALRTLGVAMPHLMAPTIGVGVIACRAHGVCRPLVYRFH